MRWRLKNTDITGSKGGKSGGGGSSFHEDDNTLQNFQTVRSLYAIGEGQIGGLVFGAQSIYLNDIALQNADGTYNFGGKIGWDQRTGLPSQPYMSGYPSASNEFAVGVEVHAASPQTRTTSSTSIDQMRITIGLPNGLCEQRTDQNALTGSSVALKVEKKITTSGSWIYDRTINIDGKTTSAYAQSELIDRPVGSGTWDVRLTRLTADATSATLRNNTFWNSYTEIQNVQLEYDNTAIIGCSVSAQDLGSQSVPTISFEVFGLYVRVPSNYDPVACTYSGVWDGTFKMAWTDNPAWHLYDLLTHPRYGLGYRITDQRVDKYSFYSAAVYNDGLVSNGSGGQERRFTCNVPIQQRDDALKVCADLASNMHAKIVWMGNRVAIIQDRPTSSTRILTPADVIDGKFDYPTTTLAERYTAANVTWNNPSDNYLQKIENVSAGSETGAFQTALNSAQNQYGYNVTEVAAYGCTRQTQARRHGRWLLDSVLNLTDIAKFQMSANGFSLQVGDVVTIHDPTIAGSQLGGRVAAGSTTTVIQLDRPVTLTAGSTISLQLPSGLETQSITATTGTVSSVTVSTAFSVAPTQYTSFLVTTSIAPRQFKLDKITQSAPGVIDLQGLLYDPNKWARIENNIALPSPVFSSFTAQNPTNGCTTLTYMQSAQFVDGSVRRSLFVGWTPPTSGIVSKYEILYRQANDVWSDIESSTNGVELSGLADGLVEVKVYAINPLGVQSPELYGSYAITIAGGSSSSLDPVISLGEQNTGSTSAFTGPDVNIKWVNPTSNGGRAISLKDFQISVLNPSTNTLLRTEYVAAVLPGYAQTYSYTFAKNMADNANTPIRSVEIAVNCRDANNNTSTGNVVTLTNPAPAVPTSISTSPAFNTNYLTWKNPVDADFQGVYVWGSLTSGFTPSSANLLMNGNVSAFPHGGLNNNEQWYYRIAAYDLFSKAQDGTGLNVSSEFTATTLSANVTNEYTLTGVTWTPNSPSANHVAWTAGTAYQTLGTGAGTSVSVAAGNAAWTSGVLFIYYVAGNGTLLTSTNITDAVGANKAIVATYRGGTNLEPHDGKAYTDGGYIIGQTIGANQLVVSSAVITTAAQMGNLTVTNAAIANAAVNTLQIAGNAVTVPSGASLGGDTNLSTTAETTLMGPVYLDTSGQPLAVMVSLAVSGTGSSPGGSNGNFYVRVNGSIVASWSVYAGPSIANTFSMSRMVYVAGPGSGSVPVTVTWQSNDGSWTARSSTQGGCSMVVLGMKR